MGARNETENAEIRLLRFAASGQARLPADGATGAMVKLSRADGRRLSTGQAVFDDAVRRALIAIEPGGVVRLTSAGRAAVKRAMSGAGGEPAKAANANFGAQHRDMSSEQRVIGGIAQTVAINHAESPLGLLGRLKGRDGRGFFEADAIMAGERLRSDFERAQMQPRVSANWEASVASGPRAANGVADLTDSAVAARLRIDKAVAAIGPELSGVVLDICCFLKGLETVERERQWPPRSAKLMLRTGLSALSRHYGYRR